jgi:hypothetical protein
MYSLDFIHVHVFLHWSQLCIWCSVIYNSAMTMNRSVTFSYTFISTCIWSRVSACSIKLRNKAFLFFILCWVWMDIERIRNNYIIIFVFSSNPNIDCSKMPSLKLPCTPVHGIDICKITARRLMKYSLHRQKQCHIIQMYNNQIHNA